MRSPIRSGGFGLKECTFPCLPAGRELAGLFLYFFLPQKKVTTEKMQ
jgi:hypothetical protein